MMNLEATQRQLARSVLAMAVSTAFLAVPASALAQDDDADSKRDKGPKADKLTVIGLTTDQRLVAFTAKKPDRERNLGRITGLQAPDSALVGIDFRVQDDMLYGVADGGGIYTLNATTGAATKVSQLTVALSGTTFGVDFNPAANALRIVSDNGQNLRHPFAGVAAGQTQTDGMLNYGGATASGITGSAYVNNDADANTGTTLFAIDASLDQVALQSPPNAGTLVATGKLTVDTGSAVGFDIYSDVRDGTAGGNVAFASLSVAGKTGLYEVNLLTGKATLKGTIGVPLLDIAIPLDQ